jgi:hypothetical protein
LPYAPAAKLANIFLFARIAFLPCCCSFSDYPNAWVVQAAENDFSPGVRSRTISLWNASYTNHQKDSDF